MQDGTPPTRQCERRENVRAERVYSISLPQQAESVLIAHNFSNVCTTVSECGRLVIRDHDQLLTSDLGYIHIATYVIYHICAPLCFIQSDSNSLVYVLTKNLLVTEVSGWHKT